MLVVGAVLLAALTGYVLVVAGDQKSGAGPGSSASSAPSAASTSSRGHTVTPAAVPCVPSVLGVAAATDAKRYGLDQQPELEIQVTNTGDAPCVADLSDSQIELLVYNGWSRVWSSHDCNVKSGNSPMTLAPRQSVRRSIRWTGLSSQPHCAGTRQRVGTGNYTLHARFAGIDGHNASFSISQ